jgi:hypothetical protein
LSPHIAQGYGAVQCPYDYSAYFLKHVFPLIGALKAAAMAVMVMFLSANRRC